MNNESNPSPLVPQGSLLEQKNKSRARVKIAVFFVLAIHGIGLMALLMQGCQKEKDPSLQAAADATNNPAPPTFEPTNSPMAPTNDTMAAAPAAPGGATAGVPAAAGAAPAPEATLAPATGPAAAVGTSEYVIAKGDSFYTVAKKFHVSINALTQANPGIEPTKLKIGQKIQIPAATASMTAAGTAAAGVTSGVPAADAAADGQIYTVKSGDSLSKIATQFGVTVKAIRSANNLKTDSIKVGQKLKIPAKGSAPAAPESVPAAPTSGAGR